MKRFSAIDLTLAQLRSISIDEEMVFIQDQGIRGFYMYDPTDNSSTDNGKTILRDGDGKRYKIAFGEVKNTASVTGASPFQTNGEDILNISDVNAKTIVVSSADIASTYTYKDLFIKDKVGDAFNTPITIQTEGLQNIDGVSFITIEVNFGSVVLYSDGFNLFTKARYG